MMFKVGPVLLSITQPYSLKRERQSCCGGEQHLRLALFMFHAKSSD